MRLPPEIVGGPEWDAAEEQMDYDREDAAGWNGNRFVKKARATSQNTQGEK